jgi:undecaprenyl-diphosphatase
MNPKPRGFAFTFFFLLFSVSGNAQNWDINLLKSINPTAPNSVVWRGFTSSVSPVIIGVPVGMYLVNSINHNEKGKVDAIHIAGSIAATLVITQGLKYAINRNRPYITYPLLVHPYDNSETDKSFPSQHTSFAFATATSLSMHYRKWYVVVPAFGWATMVGYSRLYLGEHYPSDVIAGAAIGAGSAFLSEWLTKKLWPHPHPTTSDYLLRK